MCNLGGSVKDKQNRTHTKRNGNVCVGPCDVGDRGGKRGERRGRNEETERNRHAGHNRYLEQYVPGSLLATTNTSMLPS